MSQYVLKVDKLKKVYNPYTDNEFEALHSIDFQIEEGEFVCIMGPSGSGKSTFINNISTIDMPTEGRVYINGVEVRTMSSNEIGRFRYQNLGFIFQDFNLLNSHTIYENIALPLSLARVKSNEIKERVIEIAKKVGVDSLLKKYPYECSGGQKQRVAIARALINNPKIIIADEPTGNLDSVNSHEVLKIFKQLNEEGVTIIMVSHDAMIASYSSKLVYIKDGNIEVELERLNMSWDDYFQKIVSINAQETRVKMND